MSPYPNSDEDRRLPAVRIIETAPSGMSSGPASELTPLQVALRYKWMILILAVVVSGAMYGGLKFVSPTFVAEADLRIDMPRLRLMNDSSSLLSDQKPSQELLRTEMAVLSSPRLALTAVTALGLENLRAFQLCPRVSWPQALHNLVGRVLGRPAPQPACEVSPEHAAKVLLSALNFTAAREALIIQITASQPDPQLAARLANGYADTYIKWQSDMKAGLAQQADEWLSADLANIQAKMIADDAAVEAYRQSHHLIGLHSKGNGDGAVDTISTQSLEQQNSDLGAVNAALAEKSSILAQVQQALRDGHLDAVAPVLGSQMIQSMITHQAQLSANLAELRANYGSTYPTVVAASAAVARNDAQIRTEIDKIVRGLSSEVAALNERKATVMRQVEGAEKKVAGESEAAVDLSELQRAADTDRRIYESLFVRLKQVDAERRMEQANAAVVVEATPPDFPSAPRKPMIVAGTFLASVGAGIGLAFAREMMSRRFRDTEQVESEIGLPVLGIFPKTRKAPQDIVIDDPFSIEAEAVHGVVTNLLRHANPDGGPLGRVVLVTSSLPGEGKSCFSVALGRTAVRSGMSAFVLDCDLRRPMVERLVAGERRGEIVAPPGNGLSETADIAAEVMHHAGIDERSALRYLSLSRYVDNPHGLMAWSGLSAILTHLRSRYDLVVLDTPPVLAVSDSIKLGSLADEVLLMIDWSATPREAVTSATRVLQRAQIAISGIVMTKVDLRRYARSNSGEGYYLRHYRS